MSQGMNVYQNATRKPPDFVILRLPENKGFSNLAVSVWICESREVTLRLIWAERLRAALRAPPVWPLFERTRRPPTVW